MLSPARVEKKAKGDAFETFLVFFISGQTIMFCRACRMGAKGPQRALTKYGVFQRILLVWRCPPEIRIVLTAELYFNSLKIQFINMIDQVAGFPDKLFVVIDGCYWCPADASFSLHQAERDKKLGNV